MKFGIREIAVFVLLLAFLAGSYLLGFQRIQAQRAYYQRDISEKQAMLASLSESSASVIELQAQLADLQDTIAVFERKLPREKEVDQVLSDVWELGVRHALRAPSVKPLRVDRAGVCSEQPIELTFEGPFLGFFGFLSELESSDRIIRVTELELRKITDDKPMTAKLTLNIYFEPEPLTSASAR